MLRNLFIFTLAGILFAGFCALGTWQLQRRAWKLDLIAQVESQLQQEPVPVPGPAGWPEIDKRDAYLPVHVRGQFLHNSETLVQAMTAWGSGYWVMTPLRTSQGFIVLINRGFVDAAHRDPVDRPAGQLSGPVQVEGLLRLSEPVGRLLQANDPVANRWYTRDVSAITAARELPTDKVAPYFVDAAAGSNPGGWPVGGLTVVRFRNTHLIYAITWYTLALMTLVGAWLVFRGSAARE